MVGRDFGRKLVRLASDGLVEIAVRRGLATVVAHLGIVSLLVYVQQMLSRLGYVGTFAVLLALRLDKMRAFLSDRPRVVLPFSDKLMRLAVILLVVERTYLVSGLKF